MNLYNQRRNHRMISSDKIENIYADDVVYDTEESYILTYAILKLPAILSIDA